MEDGIQPTENAENRDQVKTSIVLPADIDERLRVFMVSQRPRLSLSETIAKSIRFFLENSHVTDLKPSSHESGESALDFHHFIDNIGATITDQESLWLKGLLFVLRNASPFDVVAIAGNLRWAISATELHSGQNFDREEEIAAELNRLAANAGSVGVPNRSVQAKNGGIPPGGGRRAKKHH